MIIPHSIQPHTLAWALLPPAASDEAAQHDPLFHFLVGLSLFFFVLIIALMVFFAIRYRRTDKRPRADKSPSHNLALELGWSLPLLALVIGIFFVAAKPFLSLNISRANAQQVRVNAYRWAWEFQYPEAPGYIDGSLHLIRNVPVELTLSSSDVIHSLYVPAFRVKRDAVPGRYNKLVFTPTRAGVYPLFCAEYCGQGHSGMLSSVTVHESREDFLKWLSGASADIFEKLPEDARAEYAAEWGKVKTLEELEAFKEKLKAQFPELTEFAEKLETPVTTGEQLYASKGCAVCHSTDGSIGTGPSFKGIWGETTYFQDGSSAAVDENYIRESIVNPQAKVVENFPANTMPTFQGKLSDRQIDALIAFIRSLGNSAHSATTSQPETTP